MILFPAIDLKDGRCVRLRQGEMRRVTVFNDDPADQARRFVAAGFDHLHLVDLNGAFEGRSVNVAPVRSILAAGGAKVQLGGGIRSMDAIARWIEAGVWRLILGTAAVREPDLVESAARAFPGRIAVGIDARQGRATVEGWTETDGVDAIALACDAEKRGACALIVTDVDRDGMKTGVNRALTRAIAEAVDIPVIASGGIGGLGDLEALREFAAGAVLGRALYDGDIGARAALALAGDACSRPA